MLFPWSRLPACRMRLPDAVTRFSSRLHAGSRMWKHPCFAVWKTAVSPQPGWPRTPAPPAVVVRTSSAVATGTLCWSRSLRSTLRPSGKLKPERYSAPLCLLHCAHLCRAAGQPCLPSYAPPGAALWNEILDVWCVHLCAQIADRQYRQASLDFTAICAVITQLRQDGAV